MRALKYLDKHLIDELQPEPGSLLEGAQLIAFLLTVLLYEASACQREQPAQI